MNKVYCADTWNASAKEQKAHALAQGFNKDDVHTEGDGAEGWESLLMSYRGKTGGRVGLVGGLAVLGDSSREIKKRLAELREKKIKPYDFDKPDLTGEELYANAMASIWGSRTFKKDRKSHKKISAKGGHGKLKAHQAKRDGIAVDWLLKNIARDETITWDQKVKLLTMPGKRKPEISESVLRRRYL